MVMNSVIVGGLWSTVGSPSGLPLVYLSLKTLALWEDLARLLLMENTKEQIAQFKLPVLINGTTLEIIMNISVEQLAKAILPNAAPITASVDTFPVCPLHKTSMRVSKSGGWFCSHKLTTGGYCKHTA